MITKQNVQVTKKDVEDEIEQYEDLIALCEENGLQGVIKEVNGKTEYWYIEDMQNWIDEDKFLIRNEEM